MYSKRIHIGKKIVFLFLFAFLNSQQTKSLSNGLSGLTSEVFGWVQGDFYQKFDPKIVEICVKQIHLFSKSFAPNFMYELGKAEKQ